MIITVPIVEQECQCWVDNEQGLIREILKEMNCNVPEGHTFTCSMMSTVNYSSIVNVPVPGCPVINTPFWVTTGLDKFPSASS